VGSKQCSRDAVQKTGDVSDEPLWGRSGLTAHNGLVVECFRRTLVGSKRSEWSRSARWLGSFRRTLVGSKHWWFALLAGRLEVSDEPLWGRSIEIVAVAFARSDGFRRTLVGSKRGRPPDGVRQHPRFRRTLVGSKRPVRRGHDRGDPRFRRTLVGSKLDLNVTGDNPSFEFQTNPCGVEASHASSWSLRRVPVSDEPLWGRSDPEILELLKSNARFRRTLVGSKRGHAPPIAAGLAFQTNPCGVEAFGIQRRGRRPRRFQTNPCGVEAFTTGPDPWSEFEFQTNPCGVEAAPKSHRTRRRDRFRRTLVGSKHDEQPRWTPCVSSFRRTLVGSKRGGNSLMALLNTRFRRTLVGSKPIPVRRRRGVEKVSDEPLWGRSKERQRTVPIGYDGFRRTLVGSKQVLVL